MECGFHVDVYKLNFMELNFMVSKNELWLYYF